MDEKGHQHFASTIAIGEIERKCRVPASFMKRNEVVETNGTRPAVRA
jgi:hypothetical protein